MGCNYSTAVCTDESPVLSKFQAAENADFSIAAVRLLLRTDQGQSAFTQFLQERTDDLSLFQAIENLKQAKNDEFSALSNKIVDSYLTPQGAAPKVHLSAVMRGMISKTLAKTELTAEDTLELLATLQRAQEAIVVVLALRYYPEFVKSDYYKTWKKVGGHNPAVFYKKSVSKSNKVVPMPMIIRVEEKNQQDPTFLDSTTKDFVSISTIHMPVMPSIEDFVYGSDLLWKSTHEPASPNTGGWTDMLTSAVDTWPICVTIATARRDRFGFPLTFVNKKFTETTGFSPSEVIGHNCRFLQQSSGSETTVTATLHANEDSEAEQRRAMATALRTAQPIKVVLTNYRKDGSQFLNLLAMKPVFDQHGEYRFVVGVQFAVTAASSSHYLTLSHALLEILPDRVYCTVNE